ncbi:cell division protein FtsK [Listeria booriae]|uniref:cell division protein FtsK n=1 Tax=Listeria booriae TaxID=1552123 RepID=UPI001623C5D7|nr:cell division protein FtsK [Listeria booriae]MBC1358299.1 cell division protein FtsK [Listeria booriae]
MKAFIAKHIYQYRGTRIRYDTRYLLRRAGINLFISAFLVTLILGLWLVPILPPYPFPVLKTSESWEEIQRYVQAVEYNHILFVLLGSVLVGLTCPFLCKIIFFERYLFMKQRQMIAVFVIDRGLFDMETKQVEKEHMWDFSLGNQAKARKMVTKEHVTYFPKIYYEVTKDKMIRIRFPLDGRKYQDTFLTFTKTLEKTLYCDLDKVINEEGFICYQFIYGISRDRLTIQDLVSKAGKLPLMKRVIWDFDKLPHMLISGGTGAGKSIFILSIIKGLLNGACQKEDMKICDPKNADLADLEGIFPSVYSQKNGILMATRVFKEEMLTRSGEMKQMENYRTGNNYRALGLRPQFLIMDELASFIEMLDMKEKSEYISNLKQIVMLGRQAGFFLIVGLQRPDTEYLGGGIRDQFNFRVALGSNSEIGYRMMFGDVDKQFGFKTVKGFGYVDAGKGVISEFYSPYVNPEYDFLAEFEEIV